MTFYKRGNKNLSQIILLRPKIGFGIGGAEAHAGMIAVKLLERGFKVGVVAHTIVLPEEILKKLEIYKVRWEGFGSIPKHLFFIYQARKILSKLSNYRLISFFRYPYASDLFIMCDPMIAFLQKQRASFLKNLGLRYKILLSLEKKPLLTQKKWSPFFP